jgi:hypothetical protein
MMKELELPSDVLEAEDAVELVRFWAVNGDDVVQLYVGAMGDDEPKMWGSILADIANHAILALGQNDPSLSPENVRAQIEQGFRERLEQRIGVSGQIGGRSQ